MPTPRSRTDSGVPPILAGRFAIPSSPLLAISAAVAEFTAGLSFSVLAPPSVPTGDVPQFMTGDGGAETADASNIQAPTPTLWSRRLGIKWSRIYTSGALVGRGNWLDSTLTPEGPSPYASTGVATTVGQTLTANVLLLVQRWMSTGQNRGFYLNARGSAFPLNLYGRGDTTVGNRPKLTLVTSTGTFTLTAAANARWNVSSFRTQPGKNEFTVAADDQPAIVRFDLSSVTGTLSSATLSLVVKAFDTGHTGHIIDVFEADPPVLLDPITVASPVLGVFNEYANFSAMKAAVGSDSRLIFANDFASPGPFDSGFTPPATRILDPATGTTYALGTIAAGSQGSVSNKQNISVGVNPRGTPSIVRPSLFAHYAMRMRANFGTTNEDAIKIPAVGLQFGIWNPVGYWQQTTGNGGNVGTGLKVDNGGSTNYEYQGHSTRILTGTDAPPGDDDPLRGWFGLQLYPYNLDQGGVNPSSEEFTRVVWRRGGRYVFDFQVQQNTMSGAQDSLGNYATANADGIYRIWMNGALVYEKTNFRWRRHAEFGVEFLWLDVFHGGTTLAPQDMNYELDEVVMSTALVGPKVAAAPAVGVEPVPQYQNAKSYDNATAFTTTLGSVAVGEQFDVGTGPSTGVIARVIVGSGANINSFVIGGVTLSALPQQALTGWGSNERVFYGVGLSLTGLQAWLVTLDVAAHINVQLFAARSAVTFTAGPSVSVLNSTLSQAITSDSNTLTVGMLTSNQDTGTLTPKSGTFQRWTRFGNFYRDFIVTEAPNDPSIDATVVGGAFTYSYLGRVCYLQGAVQAAPSWLPPAGEMAALTVANGGLANNYRSQCAPYFDEFYYTKTANTYGGCFKNPYWGVYGSAMFFSGGHANCNDNSVTVAEYGATNITFKRACDPTPWFGTATDATTRGYNGGAAGETFNGTTVLANMDVTEIVSGIIRFNYGLSTIDGKPGASHTYGLGDFLGPDIGGARHGTHIRVMTPALNRISQNGAVSALVLPFLDKDAAPSTTVWAKHSLQRFNEDQYGGTGPGVSKLVPWQQRIYIVTNGNSIVRWYDLVTRTYVTGSGTAFEFDSADSPGGEMNTGKLILVPSRGLLLCTFRRAGNVIVQWMDVTVAQPTLGGTATLSMALPVNGNWAGATWAPVKNALIVGSVDGSHDAMYSIDIPAVLTNTWNVTRRPLGAGQTWPIMDTSGEQQRFDFDENLGGIVYFKGALRADQGNDTVYVYKPWSA